MRKKTKSGAFLRFYGPRDHRNESVLIETRITSDTPAAMYAELQNEDRKPCLYDRANP